MAVPVLDVRRTLTAAEGELQIGPPKSKAGMQDLLVPELVARALKRHHKAQGERLLRVGLSRPELVVDRGDGGPWWFPSETVTQPVTRKRYRTTSSA
jgi:hypothetical protein